MVEVDGGILVGRALKNEEVKVVFTLCGGLNKIYNSCVEENIDLVDMRHEQAVANAATGYATVTRSPGIALVTEGPGVINMASGIAAAWYSRVPVIGICNHTPYSHEGMGAISEFDSRDMYRGITKWIGYCTQSWRIPEFIATGFRYATTGRKGPVLLDFPRDTLNMKVEEEKASIIQPSRYRTNARPFTDPLLVKKAVEWLLKAERPGILIGSGVYWSGASEELIAFAELLKIPVCYAIGGKGCIPDDHPLCGGPVGYNFGSITGADVLLAIGVRFEELLNFGTGDFYDPDVKIISIDIEPTEIGRNRPVDLGIWGDAKTVLKQLIEAAKKYIKKSGKNRKETDWLKDIQFIVETMNKILTSDLSSSKKPIDPRRLGKEICDFLDKNSHIIMDGGDIQAHVTPLFCAKFPGSYLSALGGSLGHLGGGIPFAIGVKTAKPDNKVLVVEGDGSFLFNASEIDTAVRHNKQIVVVVGNDSQWGMVRHAQQLSKAYDVCSKLSESVRYDIFAESLGGYGELITDPEEIKPALKRAFNSGLPAVLDVRTDPTVMSFADYRHIE
jgi:acetolactate synthase-1/2/3 large subunit